ncbi:hypothetical protein VP01_2635g1 [Puccinia sorghi]|uniref:Uncharacterized protein n=1 Tax=Puccinia sorghi TaxID=27349 RepID=A0A0L6V652_9BASI|nr:hypothetical protein VP01_2635g1 [Puccinia sorghi]
MSNLSEIALLVAEMQAQQESEQIFRDCEDMQANMKASLEEQTQVTSICMLHLHASKRVGNADIFAPEKGTDINTANKKIGRGIINSLVHTDLTYDLLDIPLAAQIQVWMGFINTYPAKNDTTASLHKTFNNAIW